MSSSVIITISRQPGCGGLEIGQRLARRISAVYIDKKTITKAGEAYDAAVDPEEDCKAKSHFWELLRKTPILQDFESYIPEVKSIVSDALVHEKEEEIMNRLLGDGSAVVMGRGGFHRLRGRTNVMNVFLSGDDDYRVENYKRIFDLGEEDASALLSETDQATERYIYKVSGKEMLDLRNFDLVLNVSKLDFNCVVEIILDYIHYRFEH
ncbi:MAG: cytidylate kinase-like family protein [Eubacteriales bacterium]|nr:cytidylate kinase-like family protein [Eubacteriales bacterium]MDD3349915.1 cytidylate kinase-like family protein [Eubacteriales bacterium]